MIRLVFRVIYVYGTPSDDDGSGVIDTINNNGNIRGNGNNANGRGNGNGGRNGEGGRGSSSNSNGGSNRGQNRNRGGNDNGNRGSVNSDSIIGIDGNNNNQRSSGGYGWKSSNSGYGEQTDYNNDYTNNDYGNDQQTDSDGYEVQVNPSSNDYSTNSQYGEANPSGNFGSSGSGRSNSRSTNYRPPTGKPISHSYRTTPKDEFQELSGSVEFNWKPKKTTIKRKKGHRDSSNTSKYRRFRANVRKHLRRRIRNKAAGVKTFAVGGKETKNSGGCK